MLVQKPIVQKSTTSLLSYMLNIHQNSHIRFTSLNLKSAKIITETYASFNKLTQGGSQGSLMYSFSDGNKQRVQIIWNSYANYIEPIWFGILPLLNLFLKLMVVTNHLYISQLMKQILQKKMFKNISITGKKTLIDAKQTTNLTRNKKFTALLS